MNVKFRVCQDVAETAQVGRELFLDVVRTAVQERARAHVALGEGRGPVALYAQLGQAPDPVLQQVDFYLTHQAAGPAVRSALAAAGLGQPLHPGPADALDLVVLDVETDGRLGGVLPGSPAAREAAARVLATDGGWTLSAKALAESRTILLLALGKDRADAVKAALYGPEDSVTWPIHGASRHHGNTVLLCDRHAALAVRNLRA